MEQQPTESAVTMVTDGDSVAQSNSAAGKAIDLPPESSGRLRVKRYPRPSIEEVKKLEAEKSAELEQIKRQLSLSAGARQQVRAIRERYQGELQAVKASLQKAQERWRELLERKRALQERFRESATAPGTKVTSGAPNRKYRSVAEVDARIAELEEAQAHSTLSLSEEKRIITELSYLRVHAREQAKQTEREEESRREQREIVRRKREDLESERRQLEEEINAARKELDRQREQLDHVHKTIEEQVEKARAVAAPVDREALQERFSKLRLEIQAAWDSYREADRQWKENERLWWEQERRARQERREAESARRREQWKQRELARLLEEPPDPFGEQKQACDLVLRALLPMLPADDAAYGEIQAALSGTNQNLSNRDMPAESVTNISSASNQKASSEVTPNGAKSLAGFRPVGKTAADQDGIDQLYSKKANRGRVSRTDRAQSRTAQGHGSGSGRRQANAMNFNAELIVAFHTCGVQVPVSIAEISGTAAQTLAAKKSWEKQSLTFLEDERKRRQARIQALENSSESFERDEPGVDTDALMATEADADPFTRDQLMAASSLSGGPPVSAQKANLMPTFSAASRDSNSNMAGADPRMSSSVGTGDTVFAIDSRGASNGDSTRQKLNDDDFLALRTANGHVVRGPSAPAVQGVWASRSAVALERKESPDTETPFKPKEQDPAWGRLFSASQAAAVSAENRRLESMETLNQALSRVSSSPNP